ncbi:MAG: DedA family protein [Chitinophagales bacterium]|nr:DedA family protein [Chitinophagales bacterium]
MDYAAYGYLGLFLSSFLSATVLPLASEAVFGVLILNGFDPVLCTTVATFGNFLGGTTSYFIGRAGNWKWIEKYMGVNEKRVIKSKIYLDKYGAYSALLSWVPILGDILILMLGFFKVKILPVFVYMFVGKLFRYSVIAITVVKGWEP